MIETQVTPWALPLLVSLVMMVGLSWYGWRRWRRGSDRLALSFATLMTLFSVWSLAALVSVLSTTLQPKLASSYAANLATTAIAPAWLWFALTYADREDRLTTRRRALLAVEPLVVAVGTLTDPHHGLLYERVSLTDGSPVYLVRETGPLWELHALYTYAVVLLGSAVIVGAVVRAQRTYRLQGALIVAGALIPLVGNAAFFAGIGPENVNLTPVVVAVSGACFGIGIFRYRFLDILPVARDTVVDRMSDGYVVLDGDGRIVDLNPAASDLADVGEDEAVGRLFVEVFPEAKRLIAAGDGGTESSEFDGAITVATPEGRRHVEPSVSPLVEERGEAGRVIVFRDVTERRRVELRYQRLIENATDVVTVLDDQMRITFQSPSIERVLGYDPDEMVGDDVLDYVHPEDEAVAAETFERVTEAGEFTDALEVRFRHADGSWRRIESLGRNLLDDPVVEGVVINSRDVTEQRRQQRRLERTNERLDRFTSVLSHDLRNPLNVASGNLELAREGDEAAFDEVAAAHDRMRRIVENVLTIAREGDAVDDPEPVAVDDVARRAWDGVATDGAALVVEADGQVLGDPERLQRALENCYRNTIEHGADDAASLTVTVALDGDELSVADDGAGVDDDALGELFDDGYTTAEDGTGLGLSIVRSVAEAHGWTVRADHADGGGLRIVFGDVERA